MRKRLRQPSHPGAIIKYDYLEPLGLSVSALAEALGVSRKTLSKIVNERAGVSPDMALRLSRALNTTPDLWLNLQRTRDLWDAEQEHTGWEKVSALPGLSDGGTAEART
jgi:addiction module HigA family antidote